MDPTHLLREASCCQIRPHRHEARRRVLENAHVRDVAGRDDVELCARDPPQVANKMDEWMNE